jgi:hypothetical protein
MGKRENKYSTPGIAVPVILLLFFSVLPINAQYNENIIKSAYIERITRFIEWPDNDTAFLHGNFVIGVFDEEDLYYTLTEIFREKPIKNHKVTIIPVKSPEEIINCNLCYISENAKPIISKFVDAANYSGVLLFSGTSDFSKSGVHINFYLEDEKLKFEINEKSIDSAGFKASYLLMRNARIIQ